MSEMPTSGQGSTVAPGMTQVVEAGETYVLTDNEGEKLELVGRENPAVLDFINAFDNFLNVDATLPESAKEIRDSAWANLREKWENLPKHVVDQLPSVRSGGIRI